MATSREGTPLLMCTSCGALQDEPRHLCIDCGAPLTSHAGTDPVLGIQARGFAAYQATHSPQKPIVVIGMWIWMTPMLLMGLFLAVVSLGGLASAIWNGRVGEWPFILVMGAVGLGMIWLASTILYRTTSRFLAHKHSSNHRADDDAEDDGQPAGEKFECLACGQVFMGKVSSCPVCGWSYVSRD